MHADLLTDDRYVNQNYNLQKHTRINTHSALSVGYKSKE